jgi:hypothetical protein
VILFLFGGVTVLLSLRMPLAHWETQGQAEAHGKLVKEIKK